MNGGNSCGCISTDSLKDVISPDNITYLEAILGMHVHELLEKLYQTNGQMGLMTRYSNENCVKWRLFNCKTNPLMSIKYMHQLTVSCKL